MKLVFILFILWFSIVVKAQPNDAQLAYKYYQNKEYEKAAQLFSQLYERNLSDHFLDYCIICLINSKQYDQAEHTIKKYVNIDKKNKDFLFHLGYIYEQEGKNSKSEEHYEKAIKVLLPTNNAINGLANKFRNIRKYDWATKTYLHGREILNQPNVFLKELGENYMLERNYERMFELFIQTLQQNPTATSHITHKLSFAHANDFNQTIDPMIETHLTKIFNRRNYAPIFDELAVWYASQKKDYRKALQYAISLNQSYSSEHIDINLLLSEILEKISHFINMNYTTENNRKDLEKLAQIEYLIYKKKYQEALPTLDSLIHFSTHGISDYSTLEKVKILTQKNDCTAASALLEKLKNKSKQTYIQAEAIYQLAELKKRQKEYTQAKELYKTLIMDYSGSIYSIEAGKQYWDMKHKK